MNVISGQALQWLKADNKVSIDLVDSVAEPQASEMVRLADGSTIPQSGHSVTFSYVLHHTWEANDTFQVLPFQGYDVISGMPWLQCYQPHVDFRHHSVSLQAGPVTHTIPCLGTKPVPTVSTPEASGLASVGEFKSMAHSGAEIFVVYVQDPETEGAQRLEHPIARRIVLEEFPDVFVDEIPGGLPPQHTHDHQIPIQDGAQPQFCPTYRLSEAEKKEAKDKIQK